MTIDPDDPKLTAYALGELDEGERAEVEAQLRNSDAARQTVEEIRQTAELLRKGLQSEPALALTLDQRQALETAIGRRNGRHVAAASKTQMPLRWWHFRPAVAAAALILAAGIGYMLWPSLEAARRGGPVWRVGTPSYRPPGPEDWRRMRVARADRWADDESPASGTAFRVIGLDQLPAEDVGKLIARLQSAEAGDRRAMKRRPGRSAGNDVQKLAELGYVGGVLPPEDEPFAFPVIFPGDFDFSAEAYDHIVENPFLLVSQDPLSTFSIDVDTASYANIRRFLTQGTWPPPGAVRIEEMVNYFDYHYPLPMGDDPFSVDVEVADCPWNGNHLLARIGIKGREFAPEERPPANLVFLIDVSGSMQPANKLPLLKEAMELLVQELRQDDSVAIVVYAGASGLVLPATMCSDKATILDALQRLHSGGSTNGGSGIRLAYDTAIDGFIKGGVNRVILATDGDFNVGTTSQSELIRLIEDKAKTGVFLTVLGFGEGNLKDSTLEKLADKGNGHYAYIDTLMEARKVLVEQAGGTLVTIAKDVKIQVEFNPAEVNAYRLIGYENRLLAAQDFNDDTKDAGEIGAGHTVTAFYEIVPAGVPIDLPTVDPLKYQTPNETISQAGSGELMTVKLRYKQPDGDTSKLIEMPVRDTGLTLAEASDDYIFAASVASFGMLLRQGLTPPGPPLSRGGVDPSRSSMPTGEVDPGRSSMPRGGAEDTPRPGDGSNAADHLGGLTLEYVAELAEGAIGNDPQGYRAEFLTLVERAVELGASVPADGGR